MFDIISAVNCLLAGGCNCDGSLPRGISLDIDNASAIKISKTNNSVNINADGFVGGLQMVIKHNNEANISLSENYANEDLGFGAYRTEGNTTTIIVVAPSNGNLFTSEGDFEIVEVIAASGEGYIEVGIVDRFALLDNYPNPFNPETTISYELFTDGNVELSIYNVAGQLVNTLVSANIEAGLYKTVWNGLIKMVQKLHLVFTSCN